MGSSQHGFRSGHGTNTALSTLVSKISYEVVSKKKVLCYSADLTAAFDLLQKEIRADISIKKGIDPGLTKLILNYLTDRQGYVQIGNFRSCVRWIELGCVQGSILGPFLFNVYTSEFEKVVSPWHVVSYSDDACVTIAGESESGLALEFSETISKHSEWLSSLGMVCNQQKTEVVVFGNHGVKEVRCGNQIIPVSTHMKALGVWIDKDLKWDVQVDNLIKKCRSLGFGVRYLNIFLSQSEMRRIFLSHFISKLTYGCPVWYSATSYDLRARIRSIYYLYIFVIFCLFVCLLVGLFANLQGKWTQKLQEL